MALRGLRLEYFMAFNVPESNHKEKKNTFKHVSSCVCIEWKNNVILLSAFRFNKLEHQKSATVFPEAIE